MRAVICGCGAMSETWLECAKEIGGIELVGFVDIDVARACERAEQFGPGANFGTDLAEILTETKADVVFDTVVPNARHQTVLTALDHGCHVFSEKPMAASMDEARDLVRRANEVGRIHTVVQNRRYLAPIRRIKRFLESGAIGAINEIHSDFFLGPHFGGFRDEMDHVLLHDMAIHTFDAGRYLAGTNARSVYCHEWNPPSSWFKHGASAIAVFEMDGGSVFSYRGSWCADGLQTSWESQWRVVGARGSLTWDGGEGIRAEVVKSPNGFFSEVEEVLVPELDPADRIGGHLGVMRDFVDAVNGGHAPETAGFENINSLAMVFGATKSADRSERVDVL